MSDTMDPRSFASFDGASPETLKYVSKRANEMLAAGQINADDRVRIGVDIAKAYSNTASKSGVVEELLNLANACRGKDDLLLKIAECALQVEEFGLAGDVLKSDPSFLTRNPVARVHLAQCELTKEEVSADEVLKPLFSENIQDVEYWKRLALISEPHLGPRMALQAIQRAMQQSAKPLPPDLIFQHGLRLYQCGRWRKAKAAFKKLAGGPDAVGHLGEALVHFSLEMRDGRLASRFVQDWISANCPAGAGVAELIKACSLRLMVKDRPQARIQIEALLMAIEQGLLPSAGQYAQLIELSQTVDFDLERRAIALAHAHYPDDTDFRVLASRQRDAFTRSLGLSAKTVDGAGTAHAGGRLGAALAKFSAWFARG